jgi:hypothetical protein
MSAQTTISEIYNGYNISFRYPDDWELETSENEVEAVISLESPLTVSWTAYVMPARPMPEYVLESVLQSFQTEYDEVDIYPASEKTVDGNVIYSQEIEFVCHELINIARCMVLRNGRMTVLIMAQGFDQDMAYYERTLSEMAQSLICDPGDDVEIE